MQESRIEKPFDHLQLRAAIDTAFALEQRRIQRQDSRRSAAEKLGRLTSREREVLEQAAVYNKATFQAMTRMRAAHVALRRHGSPADIALPEWSAESIDAIFPGAGSDACSAMTNGRKRSTQDGVASQPSGATARRMLVVVAIAALALLAWQLADVFLLLFGAVIVATALRALASPLERHMRLSPRLSLTLAVVIATATLAGGAWLVGDRLVAQFGNIRERLPEALAALSGWLNAHPVGLTILDVWENAKGGDVPWSRVANLATVTIGAVGSVLLMVITGIYLAVDPAQYRAGLVRLVAPDHRDRIDAALRDSGHALSRWLLGQGISMLFVGTTTAIGLALLGMPLALSLGLIAAMLAFIPFFGPIASGVLAVLIAFLQGPTQALYVAGLCVLIQQIEGNLLMPFVQRWAVALPPVLGIIAAVIFGLLFGIVGVVFATPLMVVAMVLVQKLYIEGMLESNATSTPPAA